MVQCNENFTVWYFVIKNKFIDVKTLEFAVFFPAFVSDKWQIQCFPSIVLHTPVCIATIGLVYRCMQRIGASRCPLYSMYSLIHIKSGNSPLVLLPWPTWPSILWYFLTLAFYDECNTQEDHLTVNVGCEVGYLFFIFKSIVCSYWFPYLFVCAFKICGCI